MVFDGVWICIGSVGFWWCFNGFSRICCTVRLNTGLCLFWGYFSVWYIAFSVSRLSSICFDMLMICLHC